MKKDFSTKTYIHLLIIAVFGFLIYSNTFHAYFAFDDDFYIVRNRAIKDMRYFLEPSKVLGLTDIGINFRYAFITRIVGYFTFALNYYLHGLDVTGYHVFNLIVHIINGLLVYVLVRLIFQTPFFEDVMPEHDSFSLLTPGVFALCSALIFVSHPVQTQAVTYISQRFASLATLFYLLSILAYVKSRLSSTGHVKYAFYSISLISAVMAMLVKEISFTLPVMIALFEIFFFQGKYGRRVLLLLPFVLTMLVIPAALFIAQGSLSIEGMDQSMKTLASGPAITPTDYFFTQFRVIVTYIRLLFMPVNQNIDYDYPVYHSFFAFPVFLSFLFLLFIFCLGAYCFYCSRKTEVEGRGYLRLISLGILWFFITISVESSIIPIQDVIFEHRLYLPSVGFITAIMAGIAMLVHKLKRRSASRAITAVIVCTVSILGGTAYARNSVWKTNISLWQDVVKKSLSKARPHYNLASAYAAQGRDQEAIQEFRSAIKINPNYFVAYYNLGVIHAKHGRIEEAIQEYLRALEINPYSPGARYNLGIAYASQGRISEAIREYKRAIAINPVYFEVYTNLGVVYASLGRIDDAIKAYTRAVEINPRYLIARYNLGLSYYSLGRFKEAEKEFITALQLNSRFYRAHYDLGLTYRMQGRLEEAVREFQAVLRFNPDHRAARENLEMLKRIHR